MEQTATDVAIVGGGPAGLFAAERLLGEGYRVSLYDRMPSVGRKFLVAGSKGGLNITNAAPIEEFAARYGCEAPRFAAFLADFPPASLIAWLGGLGATTHVGSGKKVFPEGLSVGDLLARWLARLSANSGFRLYTGHCLTGVACDLDPLPRESQAHPAEPPGGPAGVELSFADAAGNAVRVRARATLLALGGASWPQTGSDGAWVGLLDRLGVSVAPLLPANCGYEADWPDYLRERFANVPLKNIVLSIEGVKSRGELMLTPYGVEGGPVYALGAAIRAEIECDGTCLAKIDLMPDTTAAAIAARLQPGPGKESLTNFYRKRLGLSGEAFTLLRSGAEQTLETPRNGSATNETTTPDSAARTAESIEPSTSAGKTDAARDRATQTLRDPARAAELIKAVPIRLFRPRPIAEAISCAGGVRFGGLNESLMLTQLPGVFCAGEMLDWEAPTGGFMLHGCFATAARAAAGCAAWLERG